MFTECTHTFDSGAVCKSPAIRGTSLCFHHTPHENIMRNQPGEYQPFELPDISSKAGIIVAIIDILGRLAARRIKRSEAATLIEGLKFLSRLMTELDQAAQPDLLEDADPTQQPAPLRLPARPKPDMAFQQMLESIAAKASELDATPSAPSRPHPNTAGTTPQLQTQLGWETTNSANRSTANSSPQRIIEKTHSPQTEGAKVTCPSLAPKSLNGPAPQSSNEGSKGLQPSSCAAVSERRG